MRKNDSFFGFSSKHIVTMVIVAMAVVFVYPLFRIPGLWASFDTPTHVTMIAQFHYALQHAYFPVVWTEGVANYGLPFGLVAHPLTNYLGGMITLLSQDPVISYKILWLIFTCISGIGIYRLLRRFVPLFPAVAGVTLYTFSAYRITNLYIRGALPEFAAAAFLPFLLGALIDFREGRNVLRNGLVITFWFSVILFTHPMYAIFSGVMTGMYMIFVYRNRLQWFVVMCAVGLAVGLNAFFLIPLKLELKYFYAGQQKNIFVEHSGISMTQVFREVWEYTCPNGDTVELRCNRVQVGIPEILLFLGGSLFVLSQRKKGDLKMYYYLIAIGGVSLILSTQYVEVLYKSISLFGSVQFPYRFLNVFILVPPVFLSLLLSRIPRYQSLTILVCIGSILILRIPQLYTKSEYNPSRAIFYHNIDNIHSVMMNTIWMDESKNYPVKDEKFEVLRGVATIESPKIDPVNHTVKINANEEVLIADYSFFFPGWHAYIDGQEVPIQWQDPAYRGFMTIAVPKGQHAVQFLFKDTSIRFVSKLISVGSILILGVISYLYYYQKKFLARIIRSFSLEATL